MRYIYVRIPVREGDKHGPLLRVSTVTIAGVSSGCTVASGNFGAWPEFAQSA